MPKIVMAGASVMMLSWIEGIRIARELGYDGFEVFGEFPQAIPGEIPKSERERGRKLAEQYNLELVVHAPFTSINIATFNNGIREESIKQQIEAVEFARDIGAKIVVVHNGDYVVDETVSTIVPEAKRIQWFYNRDSLLRIAEAGEKYGVYICLENTGFVPSKIDRTVEELHRIKESVSNNWLKFTLDIGHARLGDGVEKSIKVLEKEIMHIHFTDNFGKKDDHLVIGEGNFDYSPFIDFIKKFPHTITLEVVKTDNKPEPALKSLENFKKIISP